MDIKNVLVPTDFSEPSGMALNYGVALARKLQARLTLVHILEPLPVLEVAIEAEIAKAESERREVALQKLGNLLAPEDEDDLNLQIVLKTGNPRKEIAETVREQHADIVVLGTHGRGRLARLILGSTTEGLLRKLNVPVMTVSHTASPRKFKRILFATDLADSSHAAFAFAVDLARTLQTEIVALHALGGPMLASGELGMPVQQETLAQEARRRLEVLVNEGKRHGVAVQTLTPEGPAAAQILKATEENEADLIILGVESKGILERTLLGTTAEQVVREANVPVLSFPIHVQAQQEIRRHV